MHRTLTAKEEFCNGCKSFLSHLLLILITVILSAIMFEISQNSEFFNYPTAKIKDAALKATKASYLNSRNNLYKEETEMDKEVKNIHKMLEEIIIFKLNMEKFVKETKQTNKNLLAEMDKKIETALSVYDADQIGLFDYASQYAGGSVLCTPDTVAYPTNKTVSLLNFVSLDVMSSPDLILIPGHEPGNCFAFYGSMGRIRIKLGKEVNITAVTLEHASFKLLEDLSFAPKEFIVYGLLHADEDDGHFLGQYTFSLEGSNIQTFPIKETMQGEFQYVELHILNNHGRKEYTCVYRFRVHSQTKPKNC